MTMNKFTTNSGGPNGHRTRELQQGQVLIFVMGAFAEIPGGVSRICSISIIARDLARTHVSYYYYSDMDADAPAPIKRTQRSAEKPRSREPSGMASYRGLRTRPPVHEKPSSTRARTRGGTRLCSSRRRPRIRTRKTTETTGALAPRGLKRRRHGPRDHRTVPCG